MTTDISEKGLERLICTALTGAELRPAAGGLGTRAAIHLRRGLDMRRPAGLRPGVLRRLGPALRLPPRHPARRRGIAGPRPGQPNPAQVSGPPTGGNHPARDHRRAPQGHQARPAPDRPNVRHAVAGEREGQGTVWAEPLQRDEAAPLQP